MAEWMTNAARLTGRLPYTTSPEWLTRIRSLTRDVAEAHGERVDPEVIGELGIAHGDVPGHTLAESEAAEDAQSCGQPLLAMQTLVLHIREGRRPCQADGLGCQLDTVDRPYAGFSNRHAPTIRR